METSTITTTDINFVPTDLDPCLDTFELFGEPPKALRLAENSAVEPSPPRFENSKSPKFIAKFCFLPKPTPPKAPVFKDLKPGNVVQLEVDRSHDCSEFFGCLSRPVVILRTLGVKYVAIIPLTYKPRQSHFYPALLINGCAVYAALTGLRIVRIHRLTDVKFVGALSTHVFAKLSEQVLNFLAPPEI